MNDLYLSNTTLSKESIVFRVEVGDCDEDALQNGQSCVSISDRDRYMSERKFALVSTSKHVDMAAYGDDRIVQELYHFEPIKMIYNFRYVQDVKLSRNKATFQDNPWTVYEMPEEFEFYNFNAGETQEINESLPIYYQKVFGLQTKGMIYTRKVNDLMMFFALIGGLIVFFFGIAAMLAACFTQGLMNDDILAEMSLGVKSFSDSD
mmetsp:Transcript_27441/g.19807  ORF Transcript_27441/g.19807 Transcript_27441/m.19807 type:complete len:206 (-) Transcript_27441:1241-1858(-)|eukprot:CAMPEP_0116883702 /NCGR_PEP_ID=MMETSP0463-20121206/16308_1 /TAXON_ID=181622 /ORGANISM="Strombidinopsis sp, Strain SopsisLIS2011" /LENGTH=205 /DNA_ID=CAMNT_0004538899 /DNA_START=506 /DNA_END=1123 /DNA_ORIENTATION=-